MYTTPYNLKTPSLTVTVHHHKFSSFLIIFHLNPFVFPILIYQQLFILFVPNSSSSLPLHFPFSSIYSSSPYSLYLWITILIRLYYRSSATFSLLSSSLVYSSLHYIYTLPPKLFITIILPLQCPSPTISTKMLPLNFPDKIYKP